MNVFNLTNSYKRNFWKDPTLLSLVAVNLYLAWYAISSGLNNNTLIWLYWYQSVLIGIFNFLRILTLRQFSTKNFRGMNSNTDDAPTVRTKIGTAFFFLAHYGFFHLVYFIFLSVADKTSVDWVFVKNGAQLFLVNSAFTFLIQKVRDYRNTPNIGEMMFFPYIRIVPIHLSIIFGGFFPGLGTLVFIILKSVADVAAHYIDLRLQEKEGNLTDKVNKLSARLRKLDT